MKDSFVRLYGPWGEHPHHPVENWKYEVVNGDTRQGYWDWVAIREDSPDPHLNCPRVH